MVTSVFASVAYIGTLFLSCLRGVLRRIYESETGKACILESEALERKGKSPVRNS